MKRETVISVMVLLIAVVCAAGAVWTVYWSLQFGLTPRPPLSSFQTVLRFAAVTSAAILLLLPPLSSFQTVLRFAAVTSAAILLLLRRDCIERTTLLCAIVAAGSSALFGVGLRSTTLDVVRLLFHFLAYSLGVLVCVRWLGLSKQKRRDSRS